METYPTHNTICYKCANSVPKIINGKYVRGCRWSIRLQPVSGWYAIQTVKGNTASNNYSESYNVYSCPEFMHDSESDFEYTTSRGISDSGYIRLASEILKSQMDTYRSALMHYAKSKDNGYLGKIKAIERDLVSPYYAALSLHSVDFESVIEHYWAKFGLDRKTVRLSQQDSDI